MELIDMVPEASNLSEVLEKTHMNQCEFYFVQMNPTMGDWVKLTEEQRYDEGTFGLLPSIEFVSHEVKAMEAYMQNDKIKEESKKIIKECIDGMNEKIMESRITIENPWHMNKKTKTDLKDFRSKFVAVYTPPGITMSGMYETVTSALSSAKQPSPKHRPGPDPDKPHPQPIERLEKYSLLMTTIRSDIVNLGLPDGYVQDISKEAMQCLQMSTTINDALIKRRKAGDVSKPDTMPPTAGGGGSGPLRSSSLPPSRRSSSSGSAAGSTAGIRSSWSTTTNTGEEEYAEVIRNVEQNYDEWKADNKIKDILDDMQHSAEHDDEPVICEEDWVHPDTAMKEAQLTEWNKWCADERHNDDESENKSKGEEEYLLNHIQLFKDAANDATDGPIKTSILETLAIKESEQRENDAMKNAANKTVVVQGVVNHLEQINSSCAALRIIARMLESIVPGSDEKDYMTTDLKRMVGIGLEYGLDERDRYHPVATICKPPPGLSRDNWSSVFSTVQNYSESPLIESTLVRPFIKHAWILQNALFNAIASAINGIGECTKWGIPLPQVTEPLKQMLLTYKKMMEYTSWLGMIKYTDTLMESTKPFQAAIGHIRLKPGADYAKIRAAARGKTPPLCGLHKYGPGPEEMGLLRLAILINNQSDGLLSPEYQPNQAMAIKNIYEKKNDTLSLVRDGKVDNAEWVGVYKIFNIAISTDDMDACIASIRTAGKYGVPDHVPLAELEHKLMHILPGVRAVAFAVIEHETKTYAPTLKLVLYFDNMEETPHFYCYIYQEIDAIEFLMVFVHDVSIENLKSNTLINDAVNELSTRSV
jgi:hypothetical protein